jgi:hypothetical protein
MSLLEDALSVNIGKDGARISLMRKKSRLEQILEQDKEDREEFMQEEQLRLLREIAASTPASAHSGGG